MKRIQYLPAVIFLLAACCARSTTFRIETIDGVRYVHNIAPLWGDEVRISLENELTIGASETTDERYMLRTPSDAILDSDGRIYILDRWRPGIRVYDSNGQHLLDIGERGSGPGEFVEALSMDQDPDGNLYVCDPPGGKVASLATDGTFLRTIRPERLMLYRYRIMSDGRFVSAQVDESQNPPPVGLIADAEGRTEHWFGTGETHDIETVRWRINAAAIEINDSDDIFLAFQYQNRIQVYSPEGNLEMQIDRPLAYPIEMEMEYREYDQDGETVVYPYPLMTIISRGIGIDPQERIWVLSYSGQPVTDEDDPGAMYDPAILHYEVFDSSGVLLGYVPLPVAASTFRICGDRLLLSDPNVEACVYVYRIADLD